MPAGEAQWEEEDENEIAVDEGGEIDDVSGEEDAAFDDNEGVEQPDLEVEADGGEAPEQVAQYQPSEGEQRAYAERNQAAAALRIERRNREIMERRFAQLAQALEAKRNADPEQEEEELPDPEENAVGHLIGRQTRLEKLLTEQKQLSEQAAKNAQEQAVSAAATADVQTLRSEIGEQTFDQAMQHLGRSLFLEARESRPDLVEEELHASLGDAFRGRVLSWKKGGLNVGEQLIKFAIIRGWNPQLYNQQRQQPAAQPQRQPPAGPSDRRKPNPKEQVQNQRDRERRGRTISTVPGAAPQKKVDVGKYSLEASEEEWDNFVAGIAEQGAPKGRKKKVGFADLLQHKMRSGT
jgi:hypothetical protein